MDGSQMEIAIIWRIKKRNGTAMILLVEAKKKAAKLAAASIYSMVASKELLFSMFSLYYFPQ
jgi:hypothetical protein